MQVATRGLIAATVVVAFAGCDLHHRAVRARIDADVRRLDALAVQDTVRLIEVLVRVRRIVAV